MTKFKINDKVICIDDKDRELVEGRMYTIFDIVTIGCREYIVLKEFPKDRFWPHRFKKANLQLLPDELFKL